MLLVTVLTIEMIGLLTHIGDDGPYKDFKNGVAVVAAKHHVPQIRIEKEYLVPAPTTNLVIDLKRGDRIVFEGGGLENGRAEPTPRFQDYVATLAEPLTDMPIQDDVRLFRDDDGVVAYLKYPKGRLEVTLFHEFQGKFISTAGIGKKLIEERCVPRITAFTADTKDNVTMILYRRNDTPKNYTLKPYATVELFNEPPPPPPQSDDNDDDDHAEHFAEYAAVLKNSVWKLDHIVIVEESDKGCNGQLPKAILEPLEKAGRRVGSDPACTNTDWP